MSCDDPTFNQTLCQNVTNAGNVRKINCVGLPLTSCPALLLFERTKPCLCKCILQMICKIQVNQFFSLNNLQSNRFLALVFFFGKCENL